jgi:hypothetical protein
MGNPIGKEEFLQRAQARFGDRYDYSKNPPGYVSASALAHSYRSI